MGNDTTFEVRMGVSLSFKFMIAFKAGRFFLKQQNSAGAKLFLIK